MCVFLLGSSCSESAPIADRPRPTPSPSGFINGGPCPETEFERLGPRAGCVTFAHNADAALFVYALVDADSMPQRWRIRYETEGSEIDRPLDAGNPFSYPRAIAPIDVDGDGTDEWLIKAVDLAGHGTNWQRLQVFEVTDDDLVPLSFEGQPLFVNVAGISRMGEGARCEDRNFVLLRTEAENRQNTIWSYSERILRVTGATAELVDRREGRLRLSDYNDPDLDPYYRLECGDLVYP